MKQSNRILLYGLLASILLILLCLYTHQDEFMNQKKELVLESEQRDASLNSNVVNIKDTLEQSQSLETVKFEEMPEKQIKQMVPENLALATVKKEKKDSEISEKNISHPTVKRTIFKNKEEIRLEEHLSIKAPKKQIEEVDKNFPIEDNKPLVDNDRDKKKKPTNKSLASIQEQISNITNRHVSFYKNKAKLTNKTKVILDKVIKILKTVPNTKIIVKGYTDVSGKEKTNLWISQERAKSVKRYLGKHGIPLKNMVAKGFGESELLYGDKPYSELNRRVEIEIKRK